METIEVLKVLKPVVNWLIPFFKDNKALKLIKADMQSIGEEFLSRAYDATKKLFIDDPNRKPIYEQWLKAVEAEQEPDPILNGGVRSVIENAAQTQSGFKSEILQILKEIEQKHPNFEQKYNTLTVSGTVTSSVITQDSHDNTITYNNK